MDGTLMVGTSANSLSSGNLILNGGILEYYWSATLSRTFGTNDNQIQILEGTSGLGENGNTTLNIIFNNNVNHTVVWGSEYFKPDIFALGSAAAQAAAIHRLQNAIDLNGATRNIRVSVLTTGGSGAGELKNRLFTSSGTAGIIKSGNGVLAMHATNNVINGDITIDEGILQLGGTGTSDKLAVLSNGLDFQKNINLTTASSNFRLIKTVGSNYTLSGIISGLGGITVISGQLNLTGSNTHTGFSTISGGILSLTHTSALSTQAKINVTSGALNLNYSGTMNIDSLYLGGVEQTEGVWGSLDSSAEYKTSLITGTGLINTGEIIKLKQIPDEMNDLWGQNILHY
jgi:autotransporter-associated beta strand protein